MSIQDEKHITIDPEQDLKRGLKKNPEKGLKQDLEQSLTQRLIQDPEQKWIEVTGARANNLKNVCARIPRYKLTVITGLSGSGKSSLAFDTIFAEGQRRYIDTFSSYARGFLGNMQRPDVDKITGLSPVISIDQKTTSRNPRSTVGTIASAFFTRGRE